MNGESRMEWLLDFSRFRMKTSQLQFGLPDVRINSVVLFPHSSDSGKMGGGPVLIIQVFSVTKNVVNCCKNDLGSMIIDQ